MNNRMPFSWLKTSEPETRPVASKITIKQFYLPDGSSTQVKGVPLTSSLSKRVFADRQNRPASCPSMDEIDEVKWVTDWSKNQSG